jgi:hypothetical protein
MSIHAADPSKSEQLQLILHTLRTCGESTTRTLSRMSGSECVGTRISELRNGPEKYNITCKRQKGKYWYSLQ